MGDRPERPPARRPSVFERALRAVIALYPRAVRSDYGSEMIETYRDQIEDAGALGRLWIRTRGLLAVLIDVGLEWIHTIRTRPRGIGMERMRSELGQALRRLARARGFVTVTLLTIALGVGAFTGVYSVAQNVLFDPLPYDDPEELAWVWRNFLEIDLDRGMMSGPDFRSFSETEGVLDYAAVRSAEFNFLDPNGGNPLEVRALLTTHRLFPMLGIEPILGRTFTAEEVEVGANPTAILSYPFWNGSLGADPSVIGRDILLDGVRYAVIGVLPPDLDFVMHRSSGPPLGADLFIGMQRDLDAEYIGTGSYAGLFRFAGGPFSPRARAAIERVGSDLDNQFPNTDLAFRATPLTEDLLRNIREPLLSILAAATFLLLVMGVSLAMLITARWEARSDALAIRAALGGRWLDRIRGIAAEMILLGVVGGGLGLLAGSWTAQLFARLGASTLPRSTEIGFDLTTLSVGLCTTIALVVIGASGAVRHAAHRDRNRSLGGVGRVRTRTMAQVRTRHRLIVSQVALSLVLLVGAGLLTRNVGRLLQSDPGFTPGSTLTFGMTLDRTQYPGAPEIFAASTEILQGLSTLPEVTAAALVSTLPLSADVSQSGWSFEGGYSDDGSDPNMLIDNIGATPGIVEAGGLRLLEGRDLSPNNLREILVDDLIAGTLYPNGDAVGRQVHQGGTDTLTIVGIVDHVRLQSIHEDGRPQLFYSLELYPDRSVFGVVRTDADPTAMVASARQVIDRVDPTIPMSGVRTLDQIVGASVDRERLNLRLVGSFAIAALLITALGLYGVISGVVTHRRSEIGIRIAVGAAGTTVTTMILRQALRLVGVGVGLGLIGAWALTRLMEGMLVDLDTFDPITYALGALLMVAIGTLSAWLPSRRAAGIAPIEALRPD